jgi:POT family proton-dependent oligopeptide transporter
MMNLPLAVQVPPSLTLDAFLPVIVAVALWVGLAGYGLWNLRSHPKGLKPLFFTEMWERFSYYGMRALLMLYMIAPATAGGLGMAKEWAGTIYALYTFFVYALSVPGGWIADRFLGHRRAVALGAILIILGELGLAAGPLPLFYGGLTVTAMGTGLLKTNCTSLVGMLYEQNDPRQDAGYTLYYMGINVGAFIAPLILGFMAQGPVFATALQAMGFASNTGWRWAFGLTSLAMLAGLLQFLLRQRVFGEVGRKQDPKAHSADTPRAQVPLTQEDRNRMWVVGILVVFIMTFFFVFEQAGTTLNLFADEHTRCSFGAWSFPSSWFQSVNSLWIFLLAPVFSWLWMRLGDREPSSPAKFTWGLFFVGAGMLLLVAPSRAYTADPTLKVTPFWLIGVYLVHTLGELCLSPVGLSTVSKLAPSRYAGLMMGVFLFAIGLGNMLAGLVGGFSEHLKPATLFGGLFAITTVMAVVLMVLTPTIKRMMGGIR